MKRSTLLKHLRKHGCKLYREGSKHSIYWNTTKHFQTPIPRHTEIGNRLARKICEDLGIPKI